MQNWPSPPPPPRRSRFPFVLAGCLVGFTTLCALLVIGAGAVAFAFLKVSAPVAHPGQTADLFLLHMAAGRTGDASRLVVPEAAGLVAGLGESHRAVWGESRGCRSMNMRSRVDWEERGLVNEQRASLEYEVKGTDGKLRRLRFTVVNGWITDLSVDGEVLFGGFRGSMPFRVSPPSTPGCPEPPPSLDGPPVPVPPPGPAKPKRK